ncbi:MAG: homocysteine S-methyltransferase family protein [Clostridia bacterium]|nr:homocysteine S-methyltransferase family protein [Clostridia bacterium]
MGFLSDIKEKALVYDGSKGYMLQLMGLAPGESPENWNLTHRDKVKKVYLDYIESGCDVIQTNTFTGNRIQLEKHGLQDVTYEVNYQGTLLAKEAAAGKNVYVAASIGPTGVLMEPSGTMTFENAYEVFKEQIQAVIDGGADIINFETFTDVSEMRAAIIASKETASVPVIASMAFEQNFRTLMGTTPFACAKIMLAVHADIIGTNCSFGPESMKEIVSEMAKTGTFISVKPNAGLPTLENGMTKYHQNAHEFNDIVCEYTKYHAHLVGGCCGTTPDFTKIIKDNISLKTYQGEIDDRQYLFSLSKQVVLDEPYRIGKIEINDSMTMDDILDEVYDAVYEDVEVIEIAYSGSDCDLLRETIRNAQNIIKQPVILHSENQTAVENALRIYNGIAGIRKPVSNNYGAIVI